MEKEIRTVDKEKGIVRITTLSERWYSQPGVNKETGLPEYQFVPSVTWICDYYPKGIGYFKWLASKGWDEAQAVKESAGIRGTKIHLSTEALEDKGSLPIDTTFEGETLAVDELEAVMSFVRWHEECSPQLLAKELTVFGDGYAGTIDRIYRIGARVWVIDLKSSQYVWDSMKIQVSAYSHADIPYKSLGITDEEWAKRGLGILQLGYRLNKNKYKFTELDDDFDFFLLAKKLWERENSGAKIPERDYPLVIKLRKEETDGRPQGLSKKKQ